MLRPYHAPHGASYLDEQPRLVSSKRFLMVLPLFALFSLLAPSEFIDNLPKHLRRLADKCIHNICKSLCCAAKFTPVFTSSSIVIIVCV
jgi:hypothetical protein